MSKQQLEKLREEWDIRCKEDFDTRNSYADWWLSRIPAILESCLPDVLRIPREYGDVEFQKGWALGFNDAIQQTRSNIKELTKWKPTP